MAQFYGEIQGQRGKASRMGGKSSGLWAHIRGWHVGARIECSYDAATDEDVIEVRATGGSSGGADFPLATLRYRNGEVIVQYHQDVKA